MITTCCKKLLQKVYFIQFYFIIFFFKGQQDFINNRPKLAQFIDTNINIDGKISSDIVWRKIKPITSLTQMTPNFGSPVSEDTQIRLAYNNFYFYVSVICFDSSPEKIQVGDSRRDAALNDEDSFLFIIDTFNDQQNGFYLEQIQMVKSLMLKSIMKELETEVQIDNRVA